jgi:hypothetical protein
MASFLSVLLFPLPIIVLQNAPYSSVVQSRGNRLTIGCRADWSRSHASPRIKNETTSLFVWAPETSSDSLVYRAICFPSAVSMGAQQTADVSIRIFLALESTPMASFPKLLMNRSTTGTRFCPSELFCRGDSIRKLHFAMEQ